MFYNRVLTPGDNSRMPSGATAAQSLRYLLQCSDCAVCLLYWPRQRCMRYASPAILANKRANETRRRAHSLFGHVNIAERKREHVDIL